MPFYVLLGIHVALALVWFVAASRFRNRQQGACEALFVLLMPVVGFLILLLWRVACLVAHSDANRPEYHKDERDEFSPGTMEYQADIVPLSDTYLLGDARMKRRLFTNAIKQEVVENPDILQQAVHDDDREITYYAVSMMTAHMGKLADEIDELRQALAGEKKTADVDATEAAAQATAVPAFSDESNDRDALLRRYTELLETYLAHGYGDATSRAAMENDLRTALSERVERQPEDAETREQQIRAFLRGKAFDEADAACTRYAESHAGEEGPAFMKLVIAQARRDAAGVQAALAELRALPVRLSPRALTAIRYWGGGAPNE